MAIRGHFAETEPRFLTGRYLCFHNQDDCDRMYSLGLKWGWGVNGFGGGRVNYFGVCGCAVPQIRELCVVLGVCFDHVRFEEIKQRRNEVEDDCS